MTMISWGWFRLAKKIGGNKFLQYNAVLDRPDIYQVGMNAWTSVIHVDLKPGHLLSREQAEGLIGNFVGLLNGTLAGDPNPALTLQFVLEQYPSSFNALIERYNKRSETLANAGREKASNIAWSWYQYLTTIVSNDLYQREGGIAVTVRPTSSMFKKKTELLGENESFQLLDDTVSRIANVTQQIQWGGERLTGNDLVSFLSFWAFGEKRRPRNEDSELFLWEV